MYFNRVSSIDMDSVIVTLDTNKIHIVLYIDVYVVEIHRSLNFGT